jgi:hypothetical protein
LRITKTRSPRGATGQPPNATHFLSLRPPSLASATRSALEITPSIVFRQGTARTQITPNKNLTVQIPATTQRELSRNPTRTQQNPSHTPARAQPPELNQQRPARAQPTRNQIPGRARPDRNRDPAATQSMTTTQPQPNKSPTYEMFCNPKF